VDIRVILPTYNEAATLETVVTGIVDQGAGVLVVDDDSPDGTGKIADRLAEAHPQVDVLHRSAKDGLGRALAAGYASVLQSGESIVGQMDADGSHDVTQLGRLVDAVDRGADLAIGSRYVPGGSSTGLTPSRAMLSRFGNEYARFMLGMGVHDATSGFRAFRADLLADLGTADAAAQGYAFQIETTWRAHRLGAEIAEVPITFHTREGGSSKMSIAIPIEAMLLVTRWGVQRMVAGARRRLRR
jgi:dolichol-phosphate mannosyltransferase